MLSRAGQRAPHLNIFDYKSTGPFHQGRNRVKWGPGWGRREALLVKNLPRKELPAAPASPPGSLAAALEQVPEARRPYGWRPEAPAIPLVAILTFTVAAARCRARRRE